MLLGRYILLEVKVLAAWYSTFQVNYIPRYWELILRNRDSLVSEENHRKKQRRVFNKNIIFFFLSPWNSGAK